MSSAMAIMITSACMGLSGVTNDACSKALEAGSKQSGIEQDVDLLQKGLEREANKKARYLVGDTGMGFVGGGIFIAKTVRDKEVKFNVPTLGICDRITSNLGTEKYSLELMWSLP
jgi:hypothetical protein